MKFDELFETTVIPENVTIEDIIKMYDAGKRALVIMNKIKDKVQRKRHASMIFKNMNIIRGMIMKLTDKVD